MYSLINHNELPYVPYLLIYLRVHVNIYLSRKVCMAVQNKVAVPIGKVAVPIGNHQIDDYSKGFASALSMTSFNTPASHTSHTFQSNPNSSFTPITRPINLLGCNNSPHPSSISSTTSTPRPSVESTPIDLHMGPSTTDTNHHISWDNGFPDGATKFTNLSTLEYLPVLPPLPTGSQADESAEAADFCVR